MYKNDIIRQKDGLDIYRGPSKVDLAIYKGFQVMHKFNKIILWDNDNNIDLLCDVEIAIRDFSNKCETCGATTCLGGKSSCSVLKSFGDAVEIAWETIKWHFKNRE